MNHSAKQNPVSVTAVSNLAPLTQKNARPISIKNSLSNNGVSRTASNHSVKKPASQNMQSQEANNQSNPATFDASIDQKLVKRVQKGDKKSFDLLVIKYQGKVASIVSRYINDHHEIADVTQEAFIKAYKALKGFRGDSAFYTWLYRIAINCAKNYLISKGRRPPSSDIELDEAEHMGSARNLKDIASPESLLNKSQLETAVRVAISELPEDLRVALTLREFEGLSYDEISTVMNCPVGTVRSRIFRAREHVDNSIQNVMEGS